MAKNINVVIMGPQGSGKGTQIRLLIEKYDLQPIEVGNILRNIAKEDSNLGREVDEAINKQGKYASWDVVKRVLDKKVSELDKGKGIIFDGTPRRMEEAEYWEKRMPEIGRKFDHIFYITISEKETIKRLSSRKLCEKNGHPLIVGKDIEEDDDICPKCGSKVYRREDDTPEKIMVRLKLSEEKLGPVIEYYDKKNMITRINGESAIENVHNEIVKYIEGKNE